MGFSSSLQGASSHDAILMRIDAELRLLENMRRCLSLRIKADREYAIGINSFVLQAQKMDSVELNGSHVAKSWTVFIDETEKMVKYVKENADFLASNTIDKINALYAEKKANRKQHQEEYSRIFLELNRLQDTSHKTRNDYERCMDNYTVAKAKYEEQYGKGKIGRRLDDCRERYQKACRKLHQTHNDYVLLISEAAEFERDMRTILLPGLLEYQQAVQEDMIDKWKLILQDIRKCCPYASTKCSELQARFDASVSAVKAADEYTKFIDQNRTSPPSPVVFRFDETLLDGFQGGQITLNPLSVALDDLTIDTLKQRLQENESKLSECRSSIKEKQTSIIQYETELQTVKIKSDPASVSKMFSVKKLMDGLKKEVNELRCVEQKLVKQIEMIQSPLTDLGCEQAPAGCDIGTMEVIIDSSNVDPKPARRSLNPSNSSSNSGPAVINMLKKPFSAVSSANNLINSKKLGGSGNSFGGLNNSAAGSRSSPNLESQSIGLSENNSSATLVDGNTPAEKRKMINSNSDQLFSRHQTSSDVIDGGSDEIPSQEWEDPNATLVLETGRPLEDELWFHGVLPRGEVVRLLVKDGDFLVRETTRNDEKQIVLSVMWGAPKHFIVQTSPEGLFRFEGPAFDTVQELILHQFQSSLPVTSRSGAILKTAVVREKWELNNDDVELVDKIGRGNFGDVYRANLHQKGHVRIHVAVKTCKVTLPEEQKKKFLQEGRILKQYDHPNIVRFIGICVQKQPIMIVMELVPGGSLLNFLRNSGANLANRSLLGMCLDASAGMQYLEEKNCIHRDLAARNCLVGENNVVKISDFGMSREEEEYTVSDGLKQIPIKWTAPEALNYGKYTSLCDVWSFGVLCWEIFSKGGTPYQGMTNTRAREMLDSGYRMPAPEGTPDEMYKLMLRCWQYEPEDRPHFPEIHSAIDLFYSRLFRRSVTFETSPLVGGLRRTASRLSFSVDSSQWINSLKRHFRKV